MRRQLLLPKWEMRSTTTHLGAKLSGCVVVTLLTAWVTLSLGQDASKLQDLASTCTDGDPFSDWKIAYDACSFSGVTCANGAVTDVVASGLNLGGCQIPTTWRSGSGSPGLEHLTRLSFTNCVNFEVTGALAALDYLVELDLTGTQGSLSAVLMAFAQMTSVVTLRMPDMQFTGPLPPELTSLSALRELRLGGNMLTGSIPVGFSALNSLAVLDLHGNQDMCGPIPTGLKACQELNYTGTHIAVYLQQYHWEPPRPTTSIVEPGPHRSPARHHPRPNRHHPRLARHHPHPARHHP
ncbi:hypothetical protein VaNZ11_004607, partial [Volvox africanus]